MIWKPVNWFALQINWLASILWKILVANGLIRLSPLSEWLVAALWAAWNTPEPLRDFLHLQHCYCQVWIYCEGKLSSLDSLWGRTVKLWINGSKIKKYGLFLSSLVQRESLLLTTKYPGNSGSRLINLWKISI